MIDDTDYGLADALASLDQHGVTAAVCEVVRQVRRQNADRQEPLLGDDALTLGFTNWRNVANLLERRFEGSQSVTPTRPDHSFQLLVAGYTVSVYGLRTADPTAVAWRGSEVKVRLAEVNTAIAGDGPGWVALTFDEALRAAGHEVRDLRPRHLVFVHWAASDASNIRIWAGFPRTTEHGGAPWLQLVELTAGGGGDGGVVPRDVDGVAPDDFRSQRVPAADVTWALPVPRRDLEQMG